MKIVKLIIKLINRLNDKVGEWLAYLLFGFFLILLLEVFLRYVFNSPTVWANELSQMLFGAYAVLAGGHILRIGGHVNVDIIYSRFSPKQKAMIDIVTSILFFLFCGMLLFQGGWMFLDSISRFEHSESAWNPPLYPVRMMIPLAAVLLILQGIAKLMKDVLILFDIELDTEPDPDIGRGESL